MKLLELDLNVLILGVFTNKICDTVLGGVGGLKGIKTHNCKKSLLSFNYSKQRNFVFGGGLIKFLCEDPPLINNIYRNRIY